MTLTMRPPSQTQVDDDLSPDSPKIRRGYLIALAVGVLGLIALATALSAPREAAPTDEDVFRPTTILVPRSEQLSPAVVEDVAPVAQPQVSTRRVAPQSGGQTGASQPAAQTGGGGGNTNVTIENGTTDTETESGGSHVSNDADVSANTGTDAGP